MTVTKIDADNLHDALRKYNSSQDIRHCQWVKCNILSDLTIAIVARQYILDNGPGICRSVNITNFTTFEDCPNDC